MGSRFRWSVRACLALGLLAAFTSLWGALGRSDSAAAAEQEKPVSVAARIAPAESGQPPRLIVTATIKPGWHIYSITQPLGGPLPAKIAI
jgi:DsbC/DsbD-like thiol-disulfide interchange protein